MHFPALGKGQPLFGVGLPPEMGPGSASVIGRADAASCTRRSRCRFRASVYRSFAGGRRSSPARPVVAQSTQALRAGALDSVIEPAGDGLPPLTPVRSDGRPDKPIVAVQGGFLGRVMRTDAFPGPGRRARQPRPRIRPVVVRPLSPHSGRVTASARMRRRTAPRSRRVSGPRRFRRTGRASASPPPRECPRRARESRCGPADVRRPSAGAAPPPAGAAPAPGRSHPSPGGSGRGH